MSDSAMKNLHQRLAAVMVQVDYIRKDKKVEGYMAVTHDVVASEVRPHFVKNGVLISPSIVKHTTINTGQTTAKGTPIIRLETEIAVSFVNVDDPKDRETIVVLAHANDHGDKAPGKVLSYAVKYAILKILLIETGENEEGRNVGTDAMDADRIVALEESFKKITDGVALKDALKTAMAEANDAGDDYAYRRLIKSAEARSQELGIKPDPKVPLPLPQSKSGEAEKKAAEPKADKPGAKVEIASAGLRKTVRNLAKDQSLTDGQLLQMVEEKFGVFKSVDEISKEAGAYLLKAIPETANA